jgi:hypothetical protein
MIDLSCLDRPSPSAQDMLLSDGALSFTAGVLFLAIGVAGLAAPWLRRLYRQRLTRLMRFDQVRPRPQAWWAPSPAVAGAAAGKTAAPLDAEGLATLARDLERRITRATAAAWLAFALSALLVTHWLEVGSGMSGQVAFAAAAALLASGPALTNLPPRLSRWGLRIAFGACVLAWPLLDSVDAGARANVGLETSADDFWEIALGALVVVPAYVAMFHRNLRGQMLPLLVVLQVSALLFLLPIGFVEQHAGACFAEFSPQDDPWLIPTMLGTVGTTWSILCVWLGFRALGGLTRLIERGWLSELSMSSAITLMVIVLILVFAHLPEGSDARSGWLASLPVVWAAVAPATYACVLRPRLTGATGPQLLVLRVFARDSRRHTLLDQVQSRWRFVGPVHQIGGPDLAAMNVDPYECALFLSGRLHEQFLPAAASAAQLQARLQTSRDCEGRYRINEVFCFNSAWRSTVEQLMHLSDAVVLDVRGLTAQREGTGYEIRALARAALLPRVVAVGDDATDWANVEQLLRAEGRDPQDLQRLNLAAGGTADDLFTHLLKVAAR